MLEIDGSRYSGSGTIVRQAVAFSALTGKAIRIVNARVKRPKPGLRRQHMQAVESIRQLVNGSCDGLAPGSQEIVFRPGKPASGERFDWDIGSAGSTTALALALLPVLAFRSSPATVELRGGVFQDFAPSFYHLEQVMLPYLRRMGIEVEMRMERPGYVPAGGGILHFAIAPLRSPLKPLLLNATGSVDRMWGIALSSRLKSQAVSERMANAARQVLEAAGHRADFQVLYDDSALQPGAGLAVFADLDTHARLGSDRAGALGRRSEAIGKYAARCLLDDLATGATLDRFAGDQMIPFAALAAGESRFRIARFSEHIESSAWLSQEFLGAKVTLEGNELIVSGSGFQKDGA